MRALSAFVMMGFYDRGSSALWETIICKCCFTASVKSADAYSIVHFIIVNQ